MHNGRRNGGLMMKYLVAETRTRKHMTIRELSQRSGVAKSHIQRIEAGGASPSLEVMCRLAQALECELGELYRYP